MRIDFTFYGEPVPASRPRLGRYSTYNAPDYTAYKQALVMGIREQYGYFEWDFPDLNNPKKRAYFLKYNRYKLSIKIYRSKERGDWDNYAKTVGDAIEQAGLVVNDKQIIHGECQVLTDKENPRVEFTLEKMGAT